MSKFMDWMLEKDDAGVARKARRAANNERYRKTTSLAEIGRGALSVAKETVSDAVRTEMFGGVSLLDGTITYKGDVRAVSGATATVETAGGLDRRTSLTRVAVGGAALGIGGAIIGGVAKKKVDRRELYLVISRGDFQWIITVDPNKGNAARKFAGAVNVAGRTR